MNTKHIALYGLGAFAAFGLISCDNIEESLSQPITNPQEPLFKSESLVVTPASSINVRDMEGDAAEVKVADYTVTDLPEGFSLEGTLQLAKADDFSGHIVEVPVTSFEGALVTSAEGLASSYADNITKNPETAKLHGRMLLYAVNGKEKVRIGGLDTYYGTAEYSITPSDPGYVIEPAYYVLMGDGSAWDFQHAVKMKHSEVKDRYDDPSFTVVVEDESSLGNLWVIIPESTYQNGTLGGNECYVPVYDRTVDGISSGDLEKATGASIDKSELHNIGVPTQITIDALSWTYTQKSAVPAYYATGNGWSNWGTHWMKLFTTDYLSYNGFLNLESEFKFSPNAAWNGDFGAAEVPAEKKQDGAYIYEGICHDAGDNIKINHAGLYFCHLDAVGWAYTLTSIDSIGLIGGFNGWGGDLEMTPSDDLYIWTADFTSDGGEWKFRTNGEWGANINLGGSADGLWLNGDNITLPAGEYTITLDLSTYPATFKAEKK